MDELNARLTLYPEAGRSVHAVISVNPLIVTYKQWSTGIPVDLLERARANAGPR